MRIHIESLTFETVVGILPHERQSPQRVIVDAQLDYRYEAGRIVDYAEVCKIIENHMKTSRFKLLEEAIESTISLLMDRFDMLETIEMKIVKPDILSSVQVGISMKKSKKR